MTAKARRAVLHGGGWVTAVQLAGLVGFAAADPSAQLKEWEKHGLIFAVRHRCLDYFPGYALDPAVGYRPFRALSDVLRIFSGRKNAWGVAYWFASINGFLDGARPRDLLAKRPEQVIAAAEDEVAGIMHG